MASSEADLVDAKPADGPSEESAGAAREVLFVDRDITAEFVAADGHLEMRRGGMTVILGERFASRAAARAAAMLFVRAYRAEPVAAGRRARSRRKPVPPPH